ncbi:MAG TPA: HAD family hydrolase [Leucothrix mucor]|nr:HAD family hydrolase [Leucothrix mucor]
MKGELIYVLDFDGVICDSAIETGATGWKAAQTLWQDIPRSSPSSQLLDDFRQVRPFLETGYEAILIMCLLQQGYTVDFLCDHYAETLQDLIDSNNLKVATLKKLFGETRDRWIEDNLQEWLDMNPLFAGISDALQRLENNIWYIITTKQERFVQQILNANDISIKAERIYGMESQMSKAHTLLQLIKQHPYQSLIFIEDRLPTLLNINENKSLKNIKLQLVSWGYNTERDKQETQKHPIELIQIGQFITS